MYREPFKRTRVEWCAAGSTGILCARPQRCPSAADILEMKFKGKSAYFITRASRGIVMRVFRRGRAGNPNTRSFQRNKNQFTARDARQEFVSNILPPTHRVFIFNYSARVCSCSRKRFVCHFNSTISKRKREAKEESFFWTCRFVQTFSRLILTLFCILSAYSCFNDCCS